MVRIHIMTVPHSRQRYDTVGDWWHVDETLTVVVSELGDWKKEFCVALHETVEAKLCRASGISEEIVDKWDRDWQKNHPDNNVEPGDDPACPYHVQHKQATQIERLLAGYLGLDWDEYDRAVQAIA